MHYTYIMHTYTYSSSSYSIVILVGIIITYRKGIIINLNKTLCYYEDKSDIGEAGTGFKMLL